MVFFFFNDTATTEIYTLSLHDALPIWVGAVGTTKQIAPGEGVQWAARGKRDSPSEGDRGVRRTRTRTTFQSNSYCPRSEEHTSELQSRQYLVCRLLLEKKKKNTTKTRT